MLLKGVSYEDPFRVRDYTLFINGCQFIILFSLCKLAYQASLSCAKLKRILALGRGLVG